VSGCLCGGCGIFPAGSIVSWISMNSPVGRTPDMTLRMVPHTEAVSKQGSTIYPGSSWVGKEIASGSYGVFQRSNAVDGDADDVAVGQREIISWHDARSCHQEDALRKAVIAK
jgi:hypothetical protein